MNYTNLTVWQTLLERYELEEALHDKFFPRLQKAVEEVCGAVEFQLSSGEDEQRQESIRGKVSAKIKVECQRCLSSMEMEIIVPFRWVLAHSESDADRIGDDGDILIVEEGEPQELLYHLEDELLLEIPFYPMHNDDETCEGRKYLDVQEEIAIEEEDIRNPFSILTEMIKK